MKKKTLTNEEKIMILTTALMEYADKDNWYYDHEELIGSSIGKHSFLGSNKYDHGYEIAEKALEIVHKESE